MNKIDEILEEIIKLKDKYLIGSIIFDNYNNITLYSCYDNTSDFLSELKDSLEIIEYKGNYDTIIECMIMIYTIKIK